VAERPVIVDHVLFVVSDLEVLDPDGNNVEAVFHSPEPLVE
jgi:hypothetical protein